jgi:hypothetical protein
MLSMASFHLGKSVAFDSWFYFLRINSKVFSLPKKVMLTNRLHQIKVSISQSKEMTLSKQDLLRVLDEMDKIEEQIYNTFNLSESIGDSSLLEMVIRPSGSRCSACGRTLKTN